MTAGAKDGVGALTEREKQTLRLMVRGHDAKSIARSLDLSVHTINERLRDARRKLAVSSSREAARLLLAAEDASVVAAPQTFGDTVSGEDGGTAASDPGSAPIGGAGRSRLFLVIGVLAMTVLLALLALTGLPQGASTSPPASSDVVDPQVVEAARSFLALGDEARWADSYQLTGAAFRKLNTVGAWTRASERVRVPLGRLLTRTLLSQENLPAPPDGYEVVKFRTSFANKADAIETVTLEREGGAWRVVGVTVG